MTKSKKRRGRVTPVPTWAIFASYETEAGNVVIMVADPRTGCHTTLRPHRALRFTTRKKAETARLRLLKAREKSADPARYRCLTVQQLTVSEIHHSKARKRTSHVQEEDREYGFPDPGPIDGGDDGRPGPADRGPEEERQEEARTDPPGRRLWFNGPASD